MIDRLHSSDFVEEMIARATSQNVVWDFDGVVADTEPLHDASYVVLAERRGWLPPTDYFAALVGRTEEQIWAALTAGGFPTAGVPLDEAIPLLKAERRGVFVDLARSALVPSWLAATLMPALSAGAAAQVIVSNGDPDVIESLIVQWGLDPYVRVARRKGGADKTTLLQRYCTPGSLLFEDNAGWLARGRQLGSTTIGVVHGYNSVEDLDADFLVALN